MSQKRKRNKSSENTKVSCSECGLEMRHASIRRHLKDKHAREYKKDDVSYRLVSDGELYAGLHKRQKLNNHIELPLSTVPDRSDQQFQLVSVGLDASVLRSVEHTRAV